MTDKPNIRLDNHITACTAGLATVPSAETEKKSVDRIVCGNPPAKRRMHSVKALHDFTMVTHDIVVRKVRCPIVE